MQVVLISDTHGQHAKLTLPPGDMIIHAGDVTGNGSASQAKAFLDWFKDLNYRYKIFIAGNHDRCFESDEITASDIPRGIYYLQDSACQIDGYKIYGSPYTPEFHRWAFMGKRGKELKEKWNQIPDDTDILITHGPPFMVLDETVQGKYIGCEDLMLRVRHVKPSIHIFGHVHEGYGSVQQGPTQFVNSSVLNERYEMVNPPKVIDLGGNLVK